MAGAIESGENLQTAFLAFFLDSAFLAQNFRAMNRKRLVWEVSALGKCQVKRSPRTSS